MGGVQVEYSRVARFLPPDMSVGQSRMVDGGIEAWLFLRSNAFRSSSFPLTPQGVLDLCRYGYWVYVPKSKIVAKSKADQIQKALVVLQVSWLALQCITRRAYGLPLTLLEVHTMVHVICAVVLYIFLARGAPASVSLDLCHC